MTPEAVPTPVLALGPAPPSPLRRAVRSGFRAVGIATSGLRPLPEIVVVGAKRAGTTYFYRILEAHPQVVSLFPSSRWTPMRGNIKSPKYFDRSYDRGLRWYRAHFATSLTRHARSRRVGAPARTFDVGSGYLHHPLAAGRMAADLPDAHFVVLLRDPVERAISHWKLNRHDEVEPLGSIEAALDAEPERLAEADRVAADDPARAAWLLDTFAYAGHGDYAADVRRLLDAVGERRVSVVCAEELFSAPEAVLGTLLPDLGLEPFALPPLPAQNASPSADLPSRARDRLVADLTPAVRAIEELTGRTYPWPQWL